jgi:xylose isomerase
MARTESRKGNADPYGPQPQDRFTFGLWTVGNPGRDPFGGPTRPILPPVEAVELLAEAGAFGVNLHDDDLIPPESTSAERDKIVRDFKAALKRTGIVVPMATTNLFTHPAFKDGALTSNDGRVRALAIRKVMRAMDLGVELGARVYVFWGGREGSECDAAKDPRDAIRRSREALDYLCDYARDQKYELKFALEAKPNEPRGDLYFPTTGSYLHFITTLKHPEMVGVNPEVAHEHMAGLNMHHSVAQAMEAGKLFHIDLNDQRPGRYDQDFRFAAENPKAAFFLVRLLEDGGYEGMRHFDAHAYRTEDRAGVLDFARGCMRSYRILRAKAQQMREDREIQQVLAEMHKHDGDHHELVASYSRERAQKLSKLSIDANALGAAGLLHERLDQLVTDLLLGTR